MRLIVACTLFFIALTSNQAIAQVVTSPNAVTTKSSNASIKFENTSHSFGNIIEGQIARYDFKFVNTGTEPLILSNVSATRLHHAQMAPRSNRPWQISRHYC